MYGHTLLRIDARDQDERTRLLAYALNFTANTTETNGLIFAIGGLIGSYPGMFSILPYYLKVREYSDLENRDIWEYELNLTPAEVDRLLMHAWELRSIYFDYYFFDENCAYYLLELLEAARPDIDLTSTFRWWAVPSDTVREVVKQKGLLKRAVYRPSNATLISYRLGFMEPSDRTLARRLGRGEVGPRDPAISALAQRERTRVLEVGHDYLNYLRASGKSSVQDPEELGRGILVERSLVKAGADDPSVPVPEVRPDQGHGTSRVTIGGGRRDGANFVELRARPTYHDLMDPRPDMYVGADRVLRLCDTRLFGRRGSEGGASHPAQHRFDLAEKRVLSAPFVGNRRRLGAPPTGEWLRAAGVRRARRTRPRLDGSRYLA